MVGFSKPEIRSAMLWATVALLLTSLMPARAAATEFAKPLNVSRSRTRLDTGAAVAVGPNNKVHIVWNAFYAKAGAPDGVVSDVYYTTGVSDKFSAPVRIRVAAGWYSRLPSIAIDGNGHAHIVFRRSTEQAAITSEDDLYYVTDTKGDFKHPILLVDGKYGTSGQLHTPSDPLVHCDSRGHVHLTFLARGLKQYDTFVAYMNNLSGAWSKPALAAQGKYLDEHYSCLDRNGFVHIAFGASDKNSIDRVYYTNNRSGKFSKPLTASSSKHGFSCQFQMAVDSQGKAHIVYRAPFVMPGKPDLYYVNNMTGSFKSWKPVCDSSMFYIPQIAIDSSKVVHIAYKRGPAFGGELYYGNNSTGEFKFTSYGKLGESWYGWPRYFALGKNGSLHFAVYDFPDPESWEAEIYYVAGSWTQGFAGVPLIAGTSF